MATWEQRILRPAVFVVGVLMVLAPFYRTELTGGFATAVIVGGLLVLVQTGVLLWRDRRRGGVKTLSIHTEHGENVIAIDALEGILRDEVRKADDVRDVDVDLEVGEEGGPIRCGLRFKLNNQPDIPGRVDAHRQTVRAAFERLIPGDVRIEIDCRVDDILTGGDRPAAQKPAAEGRSGQGDGFSGPVYPVLDDSDREGESY